MKTILTFLSGIALGGGIVYFLKPQAPEPGGGHAGVVKLQAELAAKEKEISALKAKTAPESEANPPKEEVAYKIPPEVQKEMDAQQEKLKSAMEKRLSVKVDEQVAAMAARMNLTPEQREAVKSSLLQHRKDNDFSITHLMSGGGTGEKEKQQAYMSRVLNPKAAEAALDQNIQAVLTPEQQQGYAAYQQEQKANKLEMSVNKEFLRLQGAMTLTNEQKDAVFAKLTEFAQEEQENPISPLVGLLGIAAASGSEVSEQHMAKELGEENAATMQSMIQQQQERQQRRLEALGSILSPEQLKVYEGVQKSGAMLNSEIFEEGIYIDAFQAESTAAPEASADVLVAPGTGAQK